MKQGSMENNQLPISTENGASFVKDAKQMAGKVTNRKQIPQIYHNIHQQKRQGPPNKKELNKEGTVESKLPMRKEENSLKNEDNAKNKATPTKNKHVQKGKQANIPLVPNEYHLVSHSQRDKIVKGNMGTPMMNEGVPRDSHMRQKIKSGYENINIRLPQINENLENIKGDQNNAVDCDPHQHQASPSCIESVLKSPLQK